MRASQFNSLKLLILFLVFGFLKGFEEARAGVFTIPHFVAPGSFGIGVEPELITTNKLSAGVNFRYTHGISDLNNIVGIIGSGGENRRFRVGGAYTFDLFPDTDTQPGIGLAVQGLYVRLANAGSVEMTGIPYIHKQFKSSNYHVEPYIAVPAGLSLSDGKYQGLASFVVGTLFHHDEHLSSGVEVGVNLSNALTYVSGGVTYYH